jgi:hypothetical protein
MKSLFDKLNLRPQERRLVVIVGIVVFVVLNFWLVFPMFGDYGRYEQRARDAGKKLSEYKQEIQKRPAYEKELKELENQGGYVPTEEAGLRLGQEVNSQAALSQVTLTGGNAVQRQGATGKTNAFFEEAAMTVGFNSGEKELIDFLYRLADKDLLIRAKHMVLGSDPSQMRLQGQITLVKSYQRRPPPKVAATAAKPASAASAASSAQSPLPKVEAPPTPTPTSAPTVAPPKPATIPAPTLPPSSAITNRSRRALPAPVKP